MADFPTDDVLGVDRELREQLRDARRVIMLYRRYEHAFDAECITGDEADTNEMLIEASFASDEFVEKWGAGIEPKDAG